MANATQPGQVRFAAALLQEFAACPVPATGCTEPRLLRALRAARRLAAFAARQDHDHQAAASAMSHLRLDRGPA